MKALVVGLTRYGVEGDMVAPFRTHRRALRKAYGLRCRRVDVGGLEEVRDAVAAHRPDVAFVMTPWARSAEDTVAFFEDWHRDPDRPAIVYLDSFDSTSTPFFGILPFVDCYVKKQLLRDLADYERDYRGGYVFTDHLASRNHDLLGWRFGSKIPRGYEDRVRLGWNLGLSLRLQRSLRARRKPGRKTIDVYARLGLGRRDHREWYADYRQEFLDALEPLRADHRVVAVGYYEGADEPHRVSRRQYERELASSRIAISPFGWGELCWRDFEAVCCHSLLVKPDVSHLVTAPDIFEDGVTYVAVRWDLGDLEEKCRYYLEHPAEAGRIVANARRRYLEYFEEDRFVKTIGEILPLVERRASGS